MEVGLILSVTVDVGLPNPPTLECIMANGALIRVYGPLGGVTQLGMNMDP